MIPQEDKPKKESTSKDGNGKTIPNVGQHKKETRDNDKFSPGEPDNYNAEEFATD